MWLKRMLLAQKPLFGQFGGQLANLSGQLLRVPVTVSAVGATGLGQVLLLNSVTLTLYAFASGFGDVARGEASRGAGRYSGVWIARLSVRWGIAIAVLACVVSGAFLVISGGASEPDMALLFILIVIGAAGFCLPPLTAALDVSGRFGWANLVRTGGPAVGSLVSVLALLWRPTVGSCALGFAVGLLIPQTIVAARMLWKTRESLPPTSARRLPIGSWAAITLPALVSAPSIADLSIVTAVVGTTEAAGYGMANRLTVAVTLVALAHRSRQWLHFGALRDSPEGIPLQLKRELVRTTGLAAAAAAVFVAIGPAVTGALGGGEIPAPRVLYLTFGVGGVCYSAASVLSSAVAVLLAYRTVWLVTVVGLTAGVAASLALTLAIGATGAALASSLAWSGIAVACFVLLRRSLEHGTPVINGP